MPEPLDLAALALEVLGQMDLAPGRGRKREENWVKILVAHFERVQAELRSRGMLTVLRGIAYLHASRQPLETLNFRTDRLGLPSQPEFDFGLFSNECEGMCGV